MTKKERNYYLFSISIIATAIIFGAFGAHGLRKMVSFKYLTAFEVGVRYQMYTGLGLLGTSLLHSLKGIELKKFMLFEIIGLVIFCGGLYLYTLTQIKTFAIIVPIGGVSLIIGWISLMITLVKTPLKAE